MRCQGWKHRQLAGGGGGRGKGSIRGRKKDALILTGLSLRYLVSRGADVLTKEIVGK
jgi:hypothetical protein